MQRILRKVLCPNVYTIRQTQRLRKQTISSSENFFNWVLQNRDVDALTGPEMATKVLIFEQNAIHLFKDYEISLLCQQITNNNNSWSQSLKVEIRWFMAYLSRNYAVK